MNCVFFYGLGHYVSNIVEINFHSISTINFQKYNFKIEIYYARIDFACEEKQIDFLDHSLFKLPKCKFHFPAPSASSLISHDSILSMFVVSFFNPEHPWTPKVSGDTIVKIFLTTFLPFNSVIQQRLKYKTVLHLWGYQNN